VTLGGDAPLDLADAADAELDAWLPGHLAEVFHPAGTCRAGDPGDEPSVVDRAGRVIGYDRLWMMDASVLPELPACAPALTVMALASLLTERWDP